MKEISCNSNNMSDTTLYYSILRCICVSCVLQCFVWFEEAFLLWTFILAMQLAYDASSCWKCRWLRFINRLKKAFLLEDLYSSNLHFRLWSSLNFLVRSAVTAVLELEGRRNSESKRTFGDRRRNGRRNKPRCSWVHQTISLVTCVTLATYNLLRYPYNTNVKWGTHIFLVI